MSSDSIALIRTAWQATKIRYPVDDGQPLVAAKAWVQYASTVAGNGSDAMPTSMRQLASGAHVDEEIVQAYLELLRAQSTRHADIASTRSLNEGPIDIRKEGLERPVIIPFQDGTAWAFAVAYPDCVHWYDSRPNASIPNLATTPRPIVTNWTGPKVSQDRVDDAGVLALIGIRQIHQGAPHMSQECANELVSSFRARLIAELTCGELEPSAEALAAMAPAEAEAGS